MYWIERYWPVVTAILISVGFYFLQKDIKNLDEAIKKIMDASITISGTLLGFLLTILTIINSIDTRRMRFVRESGNYHVLLRYLRVAMISNVLAISFYFVTPLFLSFNEVQKCKDIIYSLMLLIILFSWFSNIRFATIFTKLLTDPRDNNSNQ